MNLNYDILWFDDDKDFFESIDTEPIISDIASWGFSPKIFPVHNPEEFNKYAPFKVFDLIVVDFKLGEEQGDTFIKSVRNHEVYTEVIFYSFADSTELWKAVLEKELEGVFVTNKKGIEQKLLRVARQSVRKVLDLENMRGILMSEVGDLDALLEDIFEKAMNGISDDQQQVVYQAFHKDSSRQTEKHQLALASFIEQPSIEALLELSDSNKRWNNFQRVKKQHEVLKKHGFENDYAADILKPRNFLAHGIPERRAEEGLLFRYCGKEYEFNDSVSQELRKKIIEYKNAFIEIVRLLD